MAVTILKNRRVEADRTSSVSVTGGFRVGWFTGSTPFATLTASPRRLVLGIRPFFFVKPEVYEFDPGQVVDLEPHTIVPFFIRELRIRHTVFDYPKSLVFCPLRDAREVAAEVRRVGFIPSASPMQMPKRDGIPLRWQPLVALAVIWNLLGVWDGALRSPLYKPGSLMLLALLMVCVGSALLPRSQFLQRIFLKPGRSVKEVGPVLPFLAYLTGFLFLMLIVFAV